MSNKHKMKERRSAYKNLPKQIDPNRGFGIPEQLHLKAEDAGVFFGHADELGQAHYIGMPQGADGNILLIGGNGSGKSSGIIKPTLSTWRGAICATDIKGELSEHYKRLYEYAAQNGYEMRPAIVFDPSQVTGLGYDPFWWISQDDPANLYTNIMDMACTIIPELPNDNQPFWIQSEQSVLAAALLYYFDLGLSFSECLCALLSNTLSTFLQNVKNCNNHLAKALLGQISEMKAETLANIDRGLRNKLITLVADPHISHAFRGEREGAKCFNWGDLERANIFLRIPPDKINQWGYAINLMYAQLIRYLERRPEQHSAEGENNLQTLLMFDEFPRFGKLDMIVDAIPTLRSKSVNICLVVQSVAQLDRLYGEYGRRIIFDNCQYQVILRANDAETQDYLCRLIGSTKVLQESVSMNLDQSGEKIGYSIQRAEAREPRVFSHELSTLEDVLILSPYGSSRVKKKQTFVSELEQSTSCARCGKDIEVQSNRIDGGMLTMGERTKIARERAEQNEKAQRLAEKADRERKEKEDNRRKFIVGGLVLDAFPELLNITPGTQAENEIRFQDLKQFLATLAAAPDLVKAVKEMKSFEDHTKEMMEGFWANCMVECVCGQEERSEL